MKIYHYREHVEDVNTSPVLVTGEYLGFSFTENDPLNANNSIQPAYTTTVAPPTIPEGKIAVWENNAWTIQVRPDPPPTPPDLTMDPPVGSELWKQINNIQF